MITLPHQPGRISSLVLLLSLHAGSLALAADKTRGWEASEPFQQLITELVRGVIPHPYIDEKDWGHTKDVVSGLYIKREGLRIKTHRTRKAVNHGTWTRYRIDLLDPSQKFTIQLRQVRTLPNNHLGFSVVCDARLRIFGRLSQWQHGVQLISLSAEAESNVRLTMQCELSTEIDSTETIPSIELKPVVRDADLQISDFRLREISQLDGPLVRKLSSGVREVLEDEIAKRRTDVVAKINRQIDKNRDHLRLSISEFASAQ